MENKTGRKPAERIPTNQKGNVPIKMLTDPRAHRSPYQLTLYVNGKKQRPCFPTYKAALARWTEHKRLEKKFGSYAVLTSPEDLMALDRAKRRLPQPGMLDAAVDFYLVHKPQQDAPALGQAVADFVAVKRGKLKRSARHTADLKNRLETFAAAFGENRPLLYFTRNNVLDWLLSLKKGARTIHNYASALSNFFGYWHGRKCLPLNPLKEITDDDLPSIQKKKKAILSPVQARALFACILHEFPEYTDFFAIEGFVGIRDAESEQFDKKWVNYADRRIIIPAEICKTDDDWILQDLPDNLWAWLDLTKARTEGEIRHPWYKAWGRIRALLRSLRPEDGQITKWPWNGLRRSFCTYDISLHDSADKTAVRLRHQAPKRLYKSYLSALRPKAEAAEYFAITPASVRGLWPQLLARA